MSIHTGTLYILVSFIRFIFPPCAKSLAEELEREAREAKLTNRTKRRKKGSLNLNADKHDNIRKNKVIDPMSSNEIDRCLRQLRFLAHVCLCGCVCEIACAPVCLCVCMCLTPSPSCSCLRVTRLASRPLPPTRVVSINLYHVCLWKYYTH